MKYDSTEISALLGSRICHDLISPLGAISNGLELLEMTGQPNSPELRLISQSIDNANSKIRFFRISYGTTPLGITLARAEILSVLGDYYKDSRLNVIWHPLQELQRRDVKIAFLAIQCLETALPYGGTIEVIVNRHGWRIKARADKLKTEPNHWNYLTGDTHPEALTSSLVQFAVFRDITELRKPEVIVDLGAAHITLSF